MQQSIPYLNAPNGKHWERKEISDTANVHPLDSNETPVWVHRNSDHVSDRNVVAWEIA